MPSKRSQLVLLWIRSLLLITFSLGLSGKAALAQNTYARGTPAESEAGQSTLSTYAQDKIETVNLANLNLNLHIPLVSIGGAVPRLTRSRSLITANCGLPTRRLKTRRCTPARERSATITPRPLTME